MWTDLWLTCIEICLIELAPVIFDIGGIAHRPHHCAIVGNEICLTELALLIFCHVDM